MGITIHYHGRFNPQADLQQMIEEVKDIATAFQWPHFVFETRFDPAELGTEKHDLEKLWGICFTPPECESVCFSFLSNGRMSSVLNLQLYGDQSNPNTADYLYMLFTKTHLAGVEIHKLVINIMRHISQKYLLDFQVSDEGSYWETNDEGILEEKFKFLNAMIRSFQSGLECIPRNDGEKIEDYLLRMMQHAIKQYSTN